MNGIFANETLNILQGRCPLSLCVTYESLKRGRSLELKEALEMEFKVVMGFMSKKDCPEFYEGVRALLVDKDKNP